MDASTCNAESLRVPPESGLWMGLVISTDGLIISASSGAEQLTGYSSRELAGRPITHILADRSVFEAAQILESAREWGIWSGELALRDRSGRQLDGSGNLTALTGGSNDISGFLLVFTFPERVASSSRLGVEVTAEIGSRLRTLAHEMNNPLAVIMGISQLILLSPQCQGRIRSDVDKLYSEIKRVVQSVEKLHGYAVWLQEHGRPTD